jgi:hypothetical protein
MSDKEETVNLIDKSMKRGHEVRQIWAVVAIDKDGNEGLPAVMKRGLVMPLLCTDPDKVSGLRKLAKECSDSDGSMRLVLRQFTDYTDIEELHDGKEG